jgi:hypothetical protein
VDTHDGAHIAGQVPPTRRHSQILHRVQPVRVDHKIAIVLVNCWRLAAISAVEKLGQGFSLDVVDVMHVEPGAVARQHDGMGLRDEVLPREAFDLLFGLSLCRPGSIAILALFQLCVVLPGYLSHVIVLRTRRFRRRLVRRVESTVWYGSWGWCGAILFDRRVSLVHRCVTFAHLHIYLACEYWQAR